MTSLDLYKFVSKNTLEYHWHDGDVLLFIPSYLLDDFLVLFKKDSLFFEDGGISITLKQDYLVIEMLQVAEYFDLELDSIFEEEK